jgi:methylase of polypeptide subunit release factors
MIDDKLIYETTGNNRYKIFWRHELNGGGMQFGPEYPSLIQTLYPNRKFNVCYEWCSGPGFIGFNILDHGLCDSLLLTDICDPAIEIAKYSAGYNNIQDKVSAYLMRDIDLLPSNTKVDLVVSNPPHYDRSVVPGYSLDDNARMGDDVDWKSHKEFYSKIGKYLADDGVILIQENEDGSTPQMFEQMISDSGLKITNVIKSPKHYTSTPELIYYIEIRKA